MGTFDRLVLGNEVRAVLERGGPVVALETAVATHGLPAPRNHEAMARMAEAVRTAGAAPAICLIAAGRLHVGASLDDVEQASEDPRREKASIRDLPYALMAGIPAGLTVSATLLAASLAGIRVFATGGIGGVHRGAEITGDVSADLPALARFSVVTVCAGAKSVLDIPRTLEYLETAGVPVYGYCTDTFPAFSLRSSGVPMQALDSPEAVAEVARLHWSLGGGGMVIGNPLPSELALDEAEWEGWMDRAASEAEAGGVRGKAVTPFLLDRVATFSAGRTVEANIALLERNATLAGQVAVALAA